MSKVIFFSDFDRYVYHTNIFLHLCQKLPGHNIKKENKVSIFTFFEVFLIFFWHHILLKNDFQDLEFS